MGHTERIIAELATLDEAQQARLLAYVQQLKTERRETQDSSPLNAEQLASRQQLHEALARFRVRLAGYRFDREEANER